MYLLAVGNESLTGDFVFVPSDGGAGGAERSVGACSVPYNIIRYMLCSGHSS